MPDTLKVWNVIRYSKFQSVGNITLHFPESFGGDTTQIHYIGFKGEATQVSVHTDVATIIRYGSLFSLSLGGLNSWKGMLLRQSYMRLDQILQITSKPESQPNYSFFRMWRSFSCKLCLFGRTKAETGGGFSQVEWRRTSSAPNFTP